MSEENKPKKPQHAILNGVLAKAAAALGENFCSVQIIAVANNIDGDSSTHSFAAGTGSFYERLGATEEWVVMQKEYAKERARIETREDLK